jgi:hypothetical protein
MDNHVDVSRKPRIIFDGTFTGDFATSNGTTTLGLGSSGSVFPGGAPTSVTVNGSNDDVAMSLPFDRYGAGMTLFSIIVPSNGTVRFAWQYQTSDLGGAGFDFGGYILNSTYTDLSSGSGANLQSGIAQLDVNLGDYFAFYVDPTDSWGGAASLTICTAPNSGVATAIPEPTSFVLAGTALLRLFLLTARVR